MPKYRVTNTIQSGNIDGGVETVVDWYKGDDLAEAIHAMVGGAVHGRNEDRDAGLPESMRFRVLNVSLHIDHSTPEPVTLVRVPTDGTDPLIVTRKHGNFYISDEPGSLIEVDADTLLAALASLKDETD